MSSLYTLGRMKRVAYPKQCSLHVEVHLLVVQAHDLHQAFKGRDLHLNGLILSRLAHDLHDVVPLALILSASLPAVK